MIFLLEFEALSLVIEILTLLPDQYFGTLGASAEEDGEVGFGGECDFIGILIEVGEVEVDGVQFEDLGDEGLEFLEGAGVGGLEDVYFLVAADFEKHGR